MKKLLGTAKKLLSGPSHNEKTNKRGKKVRFWRIGRHNIYNITAPLEIEAHPLSTGEVKIGRTTYIIGRRERRRDAREAAVVWFKKGIGFWLLDKSMPVIRGEDPFVTKITDKEGAWIVVGSVIVDWPKKANKVIPGEKTSVTWRTEFRKGRTLTELRAALRKAPFATGPAGMKDIRLVDLPDDRIGVFTRPQGKTGGLGKIGFTCISSLSELTPACLRNAPIIEGLFKDGEWGGANEIHVLDENHLGVVGHVACMTTGKDGDMIRHYKAMAFVFDYKKRKVSKYHVIATRKDFPRGGAKHKNLKDVIFTGGLIRHGDGTATLYVGLSDREAGLKVIKDPFI